MPVEYEKAPVETLVKDLSSTLEEVAYFRRRVVLTYKGVPMAVIAPMEDLEFLEEADRKIFEALAKEIDARPLPDMDECVSLEDLMKEARKRERRNRARRKRSGAKRRKLPRTHQNMYLVRAMLRLLKKAEAPAA